MGENSTAVVARAFVVEVGKFQVLILHARVASGSMRCHISEDGEVRCHLLLSLLIAERMTGAATAPMATDILRGGD